MAQFFFRALPVVTARDATMDFEQLTFALNNGDVEVNTKGELKLITGAWTNPEGFSAKLEETTSTQVRTEQAKAVARLKGTAKAKEAIPAGTTLFTLPVAFRPSAAVSSSLTDRTAGTVIFMEVTTAGVVKTEEITIAHVIAFDGITFNLT